MPLNHRMRSMDPYSRSIALFVALAAAFTCAGQTETGALKIGAGASVITPFLDAQMAGYFYPRAADGLHDDLFAKALFIDDGKNKVVLVACDLNAMPKAAATGAREQIKKRFGIPADRVMISATHSHTGPQLSPEYVSALSRRIADSVGTALGNARPARLSVGMEQESSLPHNRRYLMQDGTTVTNPGFLNPNVVKTQGPIDPRVPVIVAENENGQPFVTWINYSMHLDTVGGTWVSADYPYYTGRLLARVKNPDMLTIFTIGAAGNINHWDVRRPGPQRGNAEAQRIGEVLAGAVVKAYTRLAPLSKAAVRAVSAAVELPTPAVTADEVEEMRRVMATPPPPNVDFTLERVHAARTLAIAALAGQPIRTEIQVIAIGSVAFVGVPGELFVEFGLEIQQASPFAHTIIVELANDSIGYIPTRVAFEQGGYEPTTSRLLPSGGELITAKAIELLKRVGADQSANPP